MPHARALQAVVIGGGPAGLMAAETLTAAGVGVDLYEAMPSPGRKFLMAGKGGMNITHGEPFADFCARYRAPEASLSGCLERFGPPQIRAWMHELGIESFVGSSGRVFPVGMKAAPLLRAWLHRLRASGLRLHVRHRWCGIEARADGGYRLRFATPDGERSVDAGTLVLALGGGSWPQLGADGRWIPLLQGLGVPVAPLAPANCGFDVAWSAHMRERHAGQAVKNVAAGLPEDGPPARRGEFVITAQGVEGSLIYAFSAPLRDALAATGRATLRLDLLPERTAADVLREVARPRGSRSLSTHLQSRLGLKGAKAALLHECLPRATIADPAALALAIKALPLCLASPRPLEEAISSAGGVRFAALDASLMLRRHPGLFCAGEMLDWEAPTGGYLLTGCLATGRAAGHGALSWLQSAYRNVPELP